ncbi:hypothetical protein N8E88_04750 (plasmid) [Phyllobacterium zundukense]|uniref:Uncharacterized protein n=2 Tax=Phyllobacterium zundukense TaxID=1867719 RepID=A0ACD4CX38_9HYPH|nr:hypothetical protein N8E88_04750 [Phyllobacterium zundukense]
MIRKKGLDVTVGKTGFDACTVAQTKCGASKYADGSTAGFPSPSNAYCYSACPFILAGGVHRFVGNASQIGVHQITRTYSEKKVSVRERYVVRRGKRMLERTITTTKFLGNLTTTEISMAYRRKLNAYFKGMGTDLPSLIACLRRRHRTFPFCFIRT